jgi:hypothetical protein
LILSVHFRLNPITLLEFSHHLSGWFGMQMHFLTVRPPDVKVFALNAQHFALDGVDALHCVLIGLHEISSYPQMRQVSFSAAGGFSAACMAVDRPRQQAPARGFDDFGNRDHERLSVD